MSAVVLAYNTLGNGMAEQDGVVWGWGTDFPWNCTCYKGLGFMLTLSTTLSLPSPQQIVSLYTLDTLIVWTLKVFSLCVSEQLDSSVDTEVKSVATGFISD